MISLLDYGLSNLRSVQKAFEYLNVPVIVIDSPEKVNRATKLVLPGVGAFDAGMKGLQAKGLVEPIREAVARGVPFLGICLGMQLLFESSEESEGIEGLGLLPGRVARFTDANLRVPHMGWNQLENIENAPLLQGIVSGVYTYFVHSYYCEPADPELILATTEYGRSFAAITGRDNIFGIQFHPEKSQAVGLRLLHNFSNLATVQVKGFRNENLPGN